MKNSYPKKLITDKIKEIKSRNFQKKERPNNHVDILKNTPHLYHTMRFQYTSHRIAKIGSKIIKILKKFISNFQLNIIYRKVNLEPIILPKLKMKKNKNEFSNIVYTWTCPGCENLSYIGETSRKLEKRIRDHSYIDKQSAILKHTKICAEYQNKLLLQVGPKPTKLIKNYHSSKTEFDEESFKILKKSLSNYTERTKAEALFIQLYKPKLNEQVLCRKTVII